MTELRSIPFALLLLVGGLKPTGAITDTSATASSASTSTSISTATATATAFPVPLSESRLSIYVFALSPLSPQDTKFPIDHKVREDQVRSVLADPSIVVEPCQVLECSLISRVQREHALNGALRGVERFAVERLDMRVAL